MVDMYCLYSFYLIVFLFFHCEMLSIGSALPTISSDLRNANYVKIRHLGII